jgi:hypothetical protein
VTAARRWILIVLVLALASSTAGCGREEHLLHAKTEGLYLNIGPMLYQVQISRQLNPHDSEDRAYLIGLPPRDAELAPDETFFAVFMRVQNPSNAAHPAASDYEITDTVDTRVKPLPLPRSNVFAYQARKVAPQGLLPSAESAAANGVVGQGAALVFKLKISTLANRPLELHIRNPEQVSEQGIVELDV